MVIEFLPVGSNEISQPTKPIIDDNSDTEISSRDSDSDEQPSSTVRIRVTIWCSYV